MNGAIAYFVDRHLMVNVLALATVVLAFYFAQGVPREYIPSIDMPRITIVAKLPGASARDMETKITIPIEEAIETVDGVDEFYTTISDSVSLTTVDLYLDSTDEQVDVALQDLRDAIDGITEFPPEMEDEPVLTQFNPGKWAIVEIALSGPMDVLVGFAKDLERKIERLPDTSQATIVGLQDPEVRILVDPQKANAHGITVLDVVDAVRRRNVSSTGAVLESPSDRKQVIVWSRYEDPIEAADTIIRSQPGVGLVRVRDIARVERAREDTGLLTHTNGKPGLSIVVNKRENSDAITAVGQIRELMSQQKLPAGVEFEYVNDRTFYTSNRLEVMTSNGLIGGLFVALVLFAFMRRDSAIWVVVGIPIVFCGAIACIPAVGISFNLMSLTGLVIVLGMVVDDAVVVAENIVSARERGLAPREAAIVGATEMVKPVFAAALTTILAFGPLVALGGMPGKIMWQIPTMVVLVLVFSLLESFLVLPAHMSTAKADRNPPPRRAFMVALERYYTQALKFVLKHRALTVGVALAVLLLVMAVIRPLVPFIQFPQSDARLLFVKISTPLGTPLEQTEALATQLQSQIAQITAADFRTITARIGHQDVAGGEKERGESENEALLTVVFRDLDRVKTNTEWIQILKQDLALPLGTTMTLQSEYIGPPTDQPITVHVLANDNATRRAIALEIAEFVSASEGTTEIQIDEREGTPKLDLNLNYEKLALLGLDPQTVALTVQASFFGIEASEHRDMDDTTELRVQFDPRARGNIDEFLDTPVRAQSGRLVRLRDVVNPIETPGLDRIYHREGQRAATVRASFTPDSPHTALSYAAILENEVLPRFQGLEGVEILVGGEAEDTKEVTAEMGAVGALVVIGIGVVIWILLGSLLEALFVLIVIPFAFAGVILAFFLHGLDLSMTALLGAIGLSGVVVNASIVMLDAIHRRLKEERGKKPPIQIMQEAVVSRLRPIMVTTLTTLFGVMPTAYGIGGYDTIVSPMSIAIGWGLMFSTLVTLFVIPVLFAVAQDVNFKLNRGHPDDHFDRHELESAPSSAG
ncbi:MAG: efflux RND transporter permease subunit [Pseudomonadota bacterium]